MADQDVDGTGAGRDGLSVGAEPGAASQRILSRAELYRIIECLMAERDDLRVEVGRLASRVDELEEQVRDGGPGTPPPPAPPAWVKKNRPARTAAKVPRRKRTQAFVRRRSAASVQVVHGVDACTGCGCVLKGGTIKRHREVIEIVLAPAVVTDHALLERVCPVCATVCVPRLGPADGVVGQHRFGPTLLAVITTWHEVGRLPLRTIQEQLQVLFGVHVSLGAITAALHTVATRGAAVVTAIRDTIRQSGIVNADETGWREAGRNLYVWLTATPTARYFEIGKRDNAHIDAILGPDFGGILVTDFYGAYDHFPGEKQRCWAHLLRDVRELVATHPDDPVLARWVRWLRRLYRTARASSTDAPPEQRRATRKRLETLLVQACQPFIGRTVPQRTLCQRIVKYIHELFTFVVHPGVPSTNNAAERDLRPLVIARKIWGGTRSEQGSTDAARRATLFGTWRARGLNPFVECQTLLLSPHT